MTTDTKAVLRWNSWGGERDTQESDDGQFVLFKDHERMVGELSAERLRWFERAGEYLKRAQEAEAAIAASRAEVEGLKKDAERYRWLQKQTPYRFGKIQENCVIDAVDTLYFMADEFDQRVDEAIGAHA